MKESKILAALGSFDKLPDTAVAPIAVSARVLGVCEKVCREHPHLPNVWISPGRLGKRVGDIRKLIRDGIPKGEAGA
jgi:hypothetical protein